MKRIVLAAALALAGVPFTAPPSDAASVVITDNGSIHIRTNRHILPPPPPRFRHHFQRERVCTVKYVKTYRNHTTITKKITTCR